MPAAFRSRIPAGRIRGRHAFRGERPADRVIVGDNATGGADSEAVYLLKEIAAGHTYVGIAQGCRDAVVARASIAGAFRVLRAVDRHLARAAGASELQAVRTARDGLMRRLVQALPSSTQVTQ